MAASVIAMLSSFSLVGYGQCFLSDPLHYLLQLALVIQKQYKNFKGKLLKNIINKRILLDFFSVVKKREESKFTS
jgi:hypothetical protein